jgi:hypothetical protein
MRADLRDVTCLTAAIAARLRRTFGGFACYARVMRTVEIIAALVLALIVFAVLKVIGLVVKFALIAALLGFVIGLVLARAFRRT